MNKWIFITVFVLSISLVWWLFSGSDKNASRSEIKSPETNESAIKIIAFGDSLTAGYGLSQSEAYPAQLEAALIAKGYDVSVINAGVSGETTRGNLERAPFIALQEPDIVLLGIGGNDALRALPIAETKKNIRETVSILQNANNPPLIIILEMQAPLNTGASYKQDFDGMYEAITAENNLLIAPFITADLFLDITNKLPDGIHYNKTGYGRVVEQHVLPVTEKAMGMLEGVEEV